MDKLLCGLVHDTSGRLLSLKRAITYINENCITGERKDEELTFLLDKMEKTIGELEGVIDTYYINCKKENP